MALPNLKPYNPVPGSPAKQATGTKTPASLPGSAAGHFLITTAPLSAETYITPKITFAYRGRTLYANVPVSVSPANLAELTAINTANGTKYF